MAVRRFALPHRTHIADHKMTQIPVRHTAGISSLAWGALEPGAAEHVVACSSLDNTVTLWDLRAMRPIAHLEDHNDAVNEVTFLRGGGFATASDDKTVKLWDPRTMTSRRTLRGFGDGINKIAESRDGFIFSAADDGIVYKHSAANGSTQPVDKFMASDEAINDIIIVPISTGEAVITSSEDGAVRSWRADFVPQPQAPGAVGRQGARPQQRRAAAAVEHHVDAAVEDDEDDEDSGDDDSGIADRLISTYEDIPKAVNHVLTVANNLLCACAEHVFVIPYQNGHIAMIQGDEDVEAAALVGHADYVRGIARIAENALLTISDDKHMFVWDTTTYQPIVRRQAHESNVMAMANNGEEVRGWPTKVVTGSEDGTVVVWDLSTLAQ